MTKKREQRISIAAALLGVLVGTGLILVMLFGYAPWNDATATNALSRQEVGMMNQEFSER